MSYNLSLTKKQFEFIRNWLAFRKTMKVSNIELNPDSKTELELREKFHVNDEEEDKK
jgi:hypothetical protein